MTTASAQPFRYVVVGTGWRAEFFLRLARLLPDTLAVSAVVTRTAERAAQVEAEWGVPTARTLDEAVARERPDFVVVSVPWEVTPGLARQSVALGIPVLLETPPAPDRAGLVALWNDVGGTGLVQVAEQYPLYPGHAARIRLAEDGALGEISTVHVSSTHQYHAIALIRRMLGAGPRGALGAFSGFAETRVTAHRSDFPLVDPQDRDGWRGSDAAAAGGAILAYLDFGGGRTGLYDFTDNQWHNPLRHRRVLIRGSRGELADDAVVRIVDPRTVLESALVRRQTGVDLNLEGLDLDHVSFEGRVLYRNPWQGARLADDEVATASLLAAMGSWTRGEGAAPYPLAEASQDHSLALAIDESIAAGAAVVHPRQPWAP